MTMSFQTLLQGELSISIRDRISHAIKSAQLGADKPVHTAVVIRALGETGVLPDLAIRASTDPARSLFYTHLAELTASFNAAATTELLIYQLQSVYPLLQRLGQQSTMAESLATDLLRGEIECGRIVHLPDDKTALDIREQATGWTINGNLPLCLRGENTNCYPLVIEREPGDELDVFIIPAEAESLQTISSAPVSIDKHYVLNHLALRNLELPWNSYLGKIDKRCYRQLIAQHQVTDAICINQMSKLALDGAIEFLRNRLSNNIPLLSLDTLQQRLAALHAEWSMSRALAYSTVSVSLTDDFFTLASASQSFAGGLLQKVAPESLHLGGINHYRTDSALGRIYQEARWNNLFHSPQPAL
jgi:alkylation response protein AidB-like acyl-CoA dehydrogenase